jgi:GT2 family glycosyltransferase
MTFGDAKVALAISSFRNDDAVLAILDALGAERGHPFHHVLVVDSIGTGELAAALESRAYPRVRYALFDRNLGSAGNLMERLRLAAEAGADYVYAINHDGDVAIDAVRALARFAAETPRVGAVYPARRYVRKGGAIDVAGTRADVLGTLGRGPKGAWRGPKAVHWSSSNGALYALEPVRAGILPWGDLWMGYEDLEYGWALERHGYSQYVLGDVLVDDGYEYRLHRLGPFSFHASDKPAWYAYYQARNLVLLSRRHRRGGAHVIARLAIELGLTAAVRDEKTRRLELLARGLRDGLRGTVGKGAVP